MSAWQRFALVDCAQDAPILFSELQQQATVAGVKVRSLFEGQPEQAQGEYGPWLLEVPLDYPTRELTNWLNHRHDTGPAVAWLAAETDFEDVLDHLRKHIDVVLPNGTLGMLRFWDARVLARLLRVLKLDQQVALLGPILEWQITLDSSSFNVNRVALVELIKQQETEGARHANPDA